MSELVYGEGLQRVRATGMAPIPRLVIGLAGQTSLGGEKPQGNVRGQEKGKGKGGERDNEVKSRDGDDDDDDDDDDGIAMEREKKMLLKQVHMKETVMKVQRSDARGDVLSDDVPNFVQQASMKSGRNPFDDEEDDEDDSDDDDEEDEDEDEDEDDDGDGDGGDSRSTIMPAGVINFIARQQGTKDWSNPHTAGFIRIYASSVETTSMQRKQAYLLQALASIVNDAPTAKWTTVAAPGQW